MKFYPIIFSPSLDIYIARYFSLPCFPQIGVAIELATPFSPLRLKGLKYILCSRVSNKQPVGPSVENSMGTKLIILLGFPNANAADLHSGRVLMR